MDTFVTKITLQERAVNQRYWAGRINDAIRQGMSHKGDMMSKNNKILENIRIVTDEMLSKARDYEHRKP